MTKSSDNTIVKFPFFYICTVNCIMKLWIIFCCLEISREITVMTKIAKQIYIYSLMLRMNFSDYSWRTKIYVLYGLLYVAIFEKGELVFILKVS